MMTLLKEASFFYDITTACQALAVPRSWYYRQKAAEGLAQEKPKSRPTLKQTLSEKEKVQVRTVLNSERFADQSPR